MPAALAMLWWTCCRRIFLDGLPVLEVQFCICVCSQCGERGQGELLVLATAFIQQHCPARLLHSFSKQRCQGRLRAMPCLCSCGWTCLTTSWSAYFFSKS